MLYVAKRTLYSATDAPQRNLTPLTMGTRWLGDINRQTGCTMFLCLVAGVKTIKKCVKKPPNFDHLYCTNQTHHTPANTSQVNLTSLALGTRRRG